MEVHQGWSLIDRDGIRHQPLRPNDDEAWWTPTVCGGINLPWSQTHDPVDCPECLCAEGEREVP